MFKTVDFFIILVLIAITNAERAEEPACLKKLLEDVISKCDTAENRSQGIRSITGCFGIYFGVINENAEIITPHNTNEDALIAFLRALEACPTKGLLPPPRSRPQPAVVQAFSDCHNRARNVLNNAYECSSGRRLYNAKKIYTVTSV